MGLAESFQGIPEFFSTRSAKAFTGCDVKEEPQEFSVRTFTTLPQIEELKPLWMKWADSPHNDFDLYLHSLNNDVTVLSPYVLAVFENNVLQALLVGQVKKYRVSIVVSFVHMQGPKAKVLDIVGGARMGLRTQEIDKLLALQLIHSVRAGEIDLLCFHRLPLQSDLFRELFSVRDFLRSTRLLRSFGYAVVPLSAPQGKLPRALTGKNGREVRRKTRILESAFPGQARFKCFSEADDLEMGLRHASSVASASWQSYLYSGVSARSQLHESFNSPVRRKWLRIYILYLDQRPVAFLIGQQCGRTFYSLHAGYDSEFGRYSVGALLTAWATEHLWKTGIEQLDLGEGSQEHNRRMGGHVHEEGEVHLYSRTLLGLYVNLFFGVTRTIRSVGRHTRSGLRLQRAGRWWSQLLIRWWSRRTSGESLGGNPLIP